MTNLTSKEFITNLTSKELLETLTKVSKTEETNETFVNKSMSDEILSTFLSNQENNIKTYSKDPRKKKIQKIKETIKELEEEQLDKISSINLEEQLKLSEEEQKVVKRNFQDALQINKSKIQDLKQELKLTKLNKHSSSFFEFMPTLANRRMRRANYKTKRH